jgi:hypothetical protein
MEIARREFSLPLETINPEGILRVATPFLSAINQSEATGADSCFSSDCHQTVIITHTPESRFAALRIEETVLHPDSRETLVDFIRNGLEVIFGNLGEKFEASHRICDTGEATIFEFAF